MQIQRISTEEMTDLLQSATVVESQDHGVYLINSLKTECERSIVVISDVSGGATKIEKKPTN